MQTVRMEPTGKVYMYGRTMEAQVDDPTVRLHLVEVIRAAGPREGDRMGWGVMELLDPQTGEMDLSMLYDSRTEAEQELHRKRRPEG